MTRLQTAGIEVDLPLGWEGRIFTRSSEPQPGTAPSIDSTSPADPYRPVLHVANFGLPAELGDFGGGAVELMRNGDVFLALVDFGTEAANTPLFASRDIPRPLASHQFDPAALQRTMVGQSGLQRFFTVAGRGFCLYVVLGAHVLRPRLVPLVNEVLRGLRIT